MKKIHLFLSLLFVITCAKEDSQNPNTPPSNITKQYTLTVSAGEGGSVSTAGGTFSGGTNVSITATPSEGYRFSGWSNGSSDNPLSVTINSNTSVTANFQVIVNSYTLTVIAGEGGSVSGEGGEYEEGTEVTITATPDEGYRFKKWSDGEFKPERVIAIESDYSIIGVFEPLPSKLVEFYNMHGGRTVFNTKQILALETLLFTLEDIENNNLEEARERIDYIFGEIQLSSNIWNQISYSTNSTNSHCNSCPINIGGPVSYYGLRMLDQIIGLGNPSNSGTLKMTAVVAPCANVTRPTLPNLEPETVFLNIAPEILANDYKILYESTFLFRNWVRSITGGYEVQLEVYEVEDCTDVDFSDNGEIIFSYVSDSNELINQVPLDIAENTDFWWTIVPSGVPGDGSGYNRHFITGGMGGYKRAGDTRYNRPHFISDDAWFVRKPEHMGLGPYHEIELKAYQPQWFQHEFMHYLFSVWTQFDLEYLGGSNDHAWFNRTNWPSDFIGAFESDYYAEALTKRLLNATPSLSDGLKFPGSPYHTLQDPYDYTLNNLDKLNGVYKREPVENDWHIVDIIVSNGQITWSNNAGVSWNIENRDGVLWTPSDSPYGEQKIGIYFQTNQDILGVMFNDELYSKVE